MSELITIVREMIEDTEGVTRMPSSSKRKKHDVQPPNSFIERASAAKNAIELGMGDIRRYGGLLGGTRETIVEAIFWLTYYGNTTSAKFFLNKYESLDSVSG